MNKEKGFSLLELLIVCTLLVIIAAIAVPNISQANANYKLDAAGHSVASLLQEARMQAVKTNEPAYAKYDANGMVYVTSDPSAAYVAGNPDVALPGGLFFQTTPPDTKQLDAYVGGTAQIPLTMAFNARGLPCVPSANPAICPSTTTGFEWFIQNSRGGWEAITVTPSGRVKSWRFTTVGSGTADWQ
jgi:prepilin-type N-terminal cleavage/methylation domain-containing protein